MKRLICLFLAVLILVGIAVYAWVDAGNYLLEHAAVKEQGVIVDSDALDALRECNGGSIPDICVHKDGTPYIICGAYSNLKVTDAESAVHSMTDLSGLMKFSDTRDSFEVTQINHVDGNVYYRLQRYYDQYPVYGQEFVITTDTEGNILSLSSGYATITDWTSEILIMEEEARTIAAVLLIRWL